MSTQPFEASAGGAQAVVQITLGQVYSEVRQTHEAVQGLVQALEPVKTTLADHETRLRTLAPLPQAVEDLETQGKDHETRLRSVERGKWMVAGGAAVLAGSSGSLITWALTRR